MSEKRPSTFAPRHPLGEGKHHGHADHEQEKREDEIGQRPAVPRGVLERPVDMAPRTWIVHEQHGRNGQAAQGIERIETIVHGG